MKPPETTLRVDPGHPALPGHFPGRPVVPGVVWLDRVLTAARQSFDLPAGPTTWPRVKFLHPVPPGRPLTLGLTPTADGFRFSLTGPDGRQVITGLCRSHEPLE